MTTDETSKRQNVKTSKPNDKAPNPQPPIRNPQSEARAPLLYAVGDLFTVAGRPGLHLLAAPQVGGLILMDLGTTRHLRNPIRLSGRPDDRLRAAQINQAAGDRAWQRVGRIEEFIPSTSDHAPKRDDDPTAPPTTGDHAPEKGGRPISDLPQARKKSDG